MSDEEEKLELNSNYFGSILDDDIGSIGLQSIKSSSCRPVSKKVTVWTPVLIG